MLRVRALVTFSVLIFSANASAQYMGNLNDVMWGSVSAGHEQAVGRSSASVASVVSGDTVPSRDIGRFSPDDLQFRSDRQRTSRNLENFTKAVSSKNAAAAADLKRLFSSVDVIGEVGKAMQSYGLDPNNVADAYAIWWVSAWSAATGLKSPDSAATYQAVQAQARAAFLATSDFAKISNADRQQFAEALMVQAALLDTANDGLRGSNPEGMKQLAANTRKGAKEMGLDLDTMVLTPQGFKPREGADAGAVTGEDAPALAAGADEGTPHTTYLALAAAATLGLGSAYWFGKRSS